MGLVFIALCAVYNGSAITAVKTTTSVNRTVAEQVRVIVVWYFFMVYAGIGHETFSAQKLAGFCFVIIGVLIFNKVISINQASQPLPTKGDDEQSLLSDQNNHE